MSGCLRQIGCLVVLCVLALGASVTRHRWLPLVTPAGRDVVAELPWTPLSREGAARARHAVDGLSRQNGPVFANVAPADLASFLLDSLVRGITTGDRVAEVATRDDRILIRTEVRVSDFGPEFLSTIGGVAGRRAGLMLGGRLRVDRPGIGELVIDEIIVDAVSIPGPAIPRVTRALAVRLKRSGLRDDALGFALPGQIGDLRVKGGMITLYKSDPE